MENFQFEDGSIQPRYDSYCLSNVTSTLLSALGVENGRTKLPGDLFEGVDLTGVENVVLFVFDGLGYNEWRRQARTGFFGELEEKGRVTPITTVFPSTTSAALTTLTTGLTPQEHSLVEWFLYLKEADMVIQTLPFSPMGANGMDLLLPKVGVEVLMTGRSVFAGLAREGVEPRSYLPARISGSAYTGLMHGASQIHPYSDASDLVVDLRKSLESGKRPSFHYVYWSYIDKVEHLFGPNSEEAYIEAARISSAMSTGLTDKLDKETAARTLYVAVADHGHVNSPMEDTVWLNRYEELERSLAESPAGRSIFPWGAPRDVYLRIRDDKLDEVHDYLSLRLADTAAVVRSADLVGTGVFGSGTPSRTFLERVGNLAILPRGKKSVWYRHPGVQDLGLAGQHGGMHVDEMTVPFAVARASSVSA